MQMEKQLYRSDTNRVFAGICGGLGDYLEMDPVVLRLVWLLLAVFTGFVPGIIAYVIAVFIIPRECTSDSIVVEEAVMT